MFPRRPVRTLLATGAIVVAAAIVGAPVAGLLSTSVSNFEDSRAQNVRARKQLEAATGANPGVALVALVQPPSQAPRAAAAIARDPTVARIVRGPLSRDGRATYLAVSLKPVPSDRESAVAARMERRVAGIPGVTLGGGLVAGKQIGDQVATDLKRAEALAFPLLFVLSLLVFRGAVAAALPLVGGVVSIATTLVSLRLVNGITPLSVFALNLATGLGLGLSIDYSLFVVSRYREELAALGPGPEALRRTLATAGRTVAFSSLTVGAAMASLLAFRQPFLYSMGIGGVIVALLSAANALIVLPAILALLGARVNALAPGWLRRSAERGAEAESDGFWYRWSQAVMRRAPLVAVSTAAFLIVLGIPFAQIRFTGIDATVLPSSASSRQVSDALRTRFPADRSSPIFVAVSAPRGAGTALRGYASRLRGLPGALAVSPPRRAGPGTWEIDLVSASPALDQASKRLVGDVRGVPAPYPVAVGGQTAGFLDNQASLGRRLPVAIAFLVSTTLLLLFALTGSVVLPVKSLLMNLLTLSATFGLLVLVFQDGRLEGLLRYRGQGALESTEPILLAALAFGLSTDYAVFLLTRIKEARDAGAPNTEAVARGLERTGRIITSAALLFCVAIGAFSTSKVVFIKELGVGTALAVIIDATIVRALLVPSLMRLLGDWNWWAPAPLRRLHERFGLRE